MPEKLIHDRYGKSDVRVTKVVRHKDRHDLIEMSVDVALSGDFKASYLTGDNRKIIATDSMKNTIYVLAQRNKFESIEEFGIMLVEHFCKTYTQVNMAKAGIRQTRWKRIAVKGKPHRHSFISGGNELRTCSAIRMGRKNIVGGGLTDLLVLKTTDSSFSDFVADEYRTLPDAEDRIFATSIDARWAYNKTGIDYNKAFDDIRTAMLETFSTHKSKAVQQTLYAMGQAAFRACKFIDDINLSMPNKHRIKVNLEPFNLSNDNEIFVWTDEPFGEIVGHLTRS